MWPWPSESISARFGSGKSIGASMAPDPCCVMRGDGSWGKAARSVRCRRGKCACSLPTKCPTAPAAFRPLDPQGGGAAAGETFWPQTAGAHDGRVFEALGLYTTKAHQEGL